MKTSWGIGVAIVLLLSIAVYLLGLINLQGMVSLVLLLVGAWTFASAFLIVDRDDRTFFAGWGIVIAGLSLTYVVTLSEALAAILIAIVALILATLYFGRAQGPDASAGQKT